MYVLQMVRFSISSRPNVTTLFGMFVCVFGLPYFVDHKMQFFSRIKLYEILSFLMV